MILQNLSRLILLAVLVAAPWMFGGATGESQVWLYGGICVAVCAWLGSLFVSSSPSISDKPWTPPAVLICAGLILLFASFQLLPVSWSNFTLSHAILADWLDARLPWRIASGPISVAPADTLRELVRLFLACCVLTLSSILFCDRRHRTILYGVAAANGAALALFGCIQKINWNGLLYWTYPLSQGGQPFSSYVNRNNAAGYLNLTLACAVGLLLTASRSSGRNTVSKRHSSRRRYRSSGDQHVAIGSGIDPQDRITSHRSSSNIRRSQYRRTPMTEGPSPEQRRWNIGIVLCVATTITVGVLASASRGGTLAMVAMAVAAVALFAESRHARLILPAVAGIGVIAIGALIWSGLGAEVGQRLNTLRYVERLTDARPQHWQDTLQAVPDFPWLGTGLGTYGHAQRPYQSYVSPGWYYNADSEYVEWILEGGVVGFLLMGLLVAAACMAVWRLMATRFGPPVTDAGAALTLMLVGQLIQSATDFGITLAANQLLAAAILGSAAGRAAQRNKTSVHSEKSTVPVTTISPSMSENRYGKLSLIVTGLVLLCGSAYGWVMVGDASGAEQFLKSLPTLSEPSQQMLDETEIALLQAREVMHSTPNDAEVQLALARLHLYRLRMEILKYMQGKTPRESEQSRLWQLTSPANLLSTVIVARKRNHNATLADLLPNPAARDELKKCVDHLQRAKAQEPLLRDVDLLLSCLSPDVSRTKSSLAAHLAREAVLCPADPQRLMEVGFVAYSANVPELACKCWRQSLEMDAENPGGRLRLAIKTVGESRVLDDVIPQNDSTLLVSFAELAENQRDRALQRASRLVVGESAEDDFLRGQIAELGGDRSGAIEQYAAAVERSPFQIEWRLKLVSLYEQADRIPEAIEQLKFCANFAPNRQDLRKRLLALQQRHGSENSVP